MHCILRIPVSSFVNSLKNKYITRDAVRNVARRRRVSVGKEKDVPTAERLILSVPGLN